MNYRHAYHAGNFADVWKHTVLALAIERLKHKPAPFRVIDTHAGVGIYDLETAQAEKTGEWKQGIGRLLGPDTTDVPDSLRVALAPYLDVIANLNTAGGAPKRYPGSPEIARALLRPDDRLIANELHPEDQAALHSAMSGDYRVKLLALDGWTALKSLLPPRERRAVVLIDPPFEQPGELERLQRGLKAAVRRFATGVYLLWYPIKDAALTRAFTRSIAELGFEKAYVHELLIRTPRDPSVLNGCGLLILNPPHPLADQLPELGRDLARVLAHGPGAACNSGWLSPTKTRS